MLDEDIYSFCDKNENDIRCRCLNPDLSIIKIGEETRLPYYCWYEPCKRSDALIVKSLKKNISLCNISDCKVTLGNIKIKNGYIDVKNVCGTNSSFTNEYIRTKYLNQEIEEPIIHPIWLPISLFIITSLILIT
ncbi:late 16kDa putative membrane protein [Goatpox virus]|uniref:Late 16kDa putative membrane protein n=1 Tax=Goatpox virus TaxID=186805 RepID=A0A5C0PST4_9POXV|nr:late 16kDa putative membrane protein [Goatpox virus]